MKYRIYKTRDGHYYIKKKGWLFWHSIFSGDFIKYFPTLKRAEGEIEYLSKPYSTLEKEIEI